MQMQLKPYSSLHGFVVFIVGDDTGVTGKEYSVAGLEEPDSSRPATLYPANVQ